MEKMAKFKMLTHNDYYNMNSDKKEKYLTDAKKHITSKGSALEQKMLQLANENITHYSSDFLVHDIPKLRNEKAVYVWCIRNTGTWLIKLNHDFKEDQKSEIEFFNVIQRQEKHTFYIVDSASGTIKKVNSIGPLNFTYKYQSKDEVFERLVNQLNNDNYFKAYSLYKEAKKNITKQGEIINLIRKVNIKAV